MARRIPDTEESPSLKKDFALFGWRSRYLAPQYKKGKKMVSMKVSFMLPAKANKNELTRNEIQLFLFLKRIKKPETETKRAKRRCEIES